MKIFLIKPKIVTRGQNTNFEIVQPIALAILAALTPPDVEIEVYDERLDEIPYDADVDLVGITVDTTTVKSGYKIAKKFRGRKVPVVLGGIQPTILPDEAMQHSDSIVMGDAEKIWPTLIKDAREGNLKKCYKNTEADTELKTIKPDRRIFDGKKYNPFNPIEFARGCTNKCGFCSIPVYHKNSYRHRPIDDVINEIKQLGEGSSILFIDDNIIAKPELSKELFKQLIPLKIRWMGQSTVELFMDDELSDLMAKSGCFRLIIGFESRVKKNLMQMEKRHNIKAFTCEDKIREVQKKGIAIHGSFVFGYDHDDERSFEKAVSFAIRNKFFKCYFNCIYPYPNTTFYKTLLSQGRLLYPKWWDDENYFFGDLCFTPKPPLTRESINIHCKKAREKFYGKTSILKRFFTRAHYISLRNAAEYFIANFTYKRR